MAVNHSKAGSIFGSWLFCPTGSDFYPNIHKFHEGPFASIFVGTESDELNITKKHNQAVEEISFSANSQGHSLERVYQLGKWNVEKASPDVIASLVLYIDHSATIVRYGPDPCYQSMEKYSATTNGRFLTAEIDIILPNGTITKMKKIFTRKPQTFPSFESFVIGPSTAGWLINNLRSYDILRAVDVSFVCAKKITPPGVFNPTNENTGEMLHPCRRFEGKITDGQEVVVFVFLVSFGGNSWHVAHRYKEFDALKSFIYHRKHLQSAKYWQKLEAEPSFPRKSLIKTLAPTDSMMESRIIGLTDFLLFHVQNGGHHIQSIIDALSAFLEIPTHLHAHMQLTGLNSGAISKSISKASTPTATDSRSSAVSNAVKAPVANTGKTPINTANNSSSTTAGPGAAGTANPTSANTVATIPKKEKYSMTYTDLLNLSTFGIIQLDTTAVYRYPQDALHTILSSGILVVKHGRTGSPKEKVLQCDGNVSKLYWSEKPSNKDLVAAKTIGHLELSPKAKFIQFSEVKSIIRGTDPDPEHIDEPIEDKLPAQNTAAAGKKPASRMSFSLRHHNKELGTKVIRRAGLSEKELSLCFSLILGDRTLDIQCLNVQDFHFLFDSLSEYIKILHSKQ